MATSDVRGRRADDVLAMQRSARTGGTASLLRWLAARTGAKMLLLDADGAVLASAGAGCPPEHLALVRSGAARLRARDLGSLVLDGANRTTLVVRLNRVPDSCTPVFAAVTSRPVPDGLPTLLADASSALDLCWRMEHTERRWRRLQQTEARNREAVLHMLMNGHVGTARQIADVLGPPLPDEMCFYVVEAPSRLRDELAYRCAGLAPDAWVVPCPVYDDHVLVVAPAARGRASAGPGPLGAAVAALADECLVGVSDPLPLRDTATGYAQAFRALVTARGRSDRWATFAHRPDPVLVLGPAAGDWATRFLAPMRGHVARRPQDPDGGELAATAAAWLAFSSKASALLKIHRNTLLARIRLVESLLSLDLERLGDQAVLALALRAQAGPRLGPSAEPAAHSLDELLTRPAMVEWAHHLLHPVDALAPTTDLARTLDTWLGLDARLAPTAAALALSTTAVRKRLVRAEELLERSLLRPPSDRHDLWLARHTVRLTAAE